MNHARRKRIQEAIEILEECEAEEREAFERTPDSLADSAPNLQREENADTLQEALDLLRPLVE